MSYSFFKSGTVAKIGKPRAQLGFRSGFAVNRFVQVEEKNAAAGTASLSDAGVDGEDVSYRTLLNQVLHCTGDSHQIFIGPPTILPKFQGFPYSYQFQARDSVPETLGIMITSDRCAWNTRALPVISSDGNIMPHSSTTAHTSDVGAGGVENEDTFEALVDSFDEDLHSRKVSVLSFHPRKYKRKKTCLIIFQADEMMNQLRAVFQKHEDQMMDSLESSKYQCGVGVGL